MVDHSMMKLGKMPPLHDPGRRLMASNYLNMLPAPATAYDWTFGQTSYGMMLNNKLGNCTIAGVGHARQMWTRALGTVMYTTPDPIIQKYYVDWDGYIIGDPSTDNGGVEADVLDQWRQNSFDMFQLKAYVDCNHLNHMHVMQSIQYFALAYVGANLPISAQSQDVWDVELGPTGIPGSWGGHCFIVVKYDSTGIWCITWGGLKKMTWAWWDAYVDECHVLLAQVWLDNGPVKYPFMGKLDDDLACVTA